MIEENTHSRILSIDIVRGIVMALMVIDHVRHSFTGAALSFYGNNSSLISEVTNLAVTTPSLFSMRWITHLCAPSFIFLAGVSIFFWNRKYSITHSQTKHFVARGMMLIVIDLLLNARSIISHEGFVYMGVLWAIGASMILFPFVAKLSTKYIVLTLCSITALSHILSFYAMPNAHDILRITFIKGSLTSLSTQDFNFFIGYPVLPWFSVMLLGFVCARIFTMKNAQQRLNILYIAGSACLLAFVALRVIYDYSGLLHFPYYGFCWKTFASFINVSKYPPSLLYLFITLGIMFFMLALTERFNVKSKILLIFGTTPLFFYCIHLLYIKFTTVCLKQIKAYLPTLVESSFTPVGVIIYSTLLIVLLYPTCIIFKKVNKIKLP